MKVSIIVPTYNVKDYILTCLDSIKNQTYTDFEVLIVDDRGSDNSIELVEEFIEKTKDNRFKILKNPHNLGLSGARNTGLKAAKGEYIYFIDSDDYITQDCLKSLIDPTSHTEYDVVIGNYALHNPDGTSTVGEEMNSSLNEIIGRQEISRLYAEGKWYVMAWNKLCKRSFLLENNLFFEEGLLHEDVVWSFKVFSTANSVALVNKHTYNYIVRSQSIMTSMSIEKDLNIYLNVFDKIKEFIKDSDHQLLPSQYRLMEGKKSGIVYSLLSIGRADLLRKHYNGFRKQMLVYPLTAYRNKYIGLGGLLRDLHYMLPAKFGASYRILFYNIAYKWRGKQIQGQVWK